MDNKINVMGVLNSINKDNILAEAEQIETSSYDNATQIKVPDALIRCAKGITADELSDFDAKNTASETAISESQVFICTKASASKTTWQLGHMYFYDSSLKKISDITPATGGSGTGGTGVNLTVDFHTTEAKTTDDITVRYTWTSPNTGYGTVYYILDYVSAGTVRTLQGTGSWSVGKLSRGTHVLQMYVTDSANQSSSQWILEITVGSLEISSTYSENSTVEYGHSVQIPYTLYFPNNDNLVLITQLDSNEAVQETLPTPYKSGDTLSYSLASLQDGQHTFKMHLKNTRTDGTVEESNILEFNIISAVAGKLYATATNPTISIYEYNVLTLKAFVTYLGAASLTAKITQVRDQSGVIVSGYQLPSAYQWINGYNEMSISQLPGVGTFYFDVLVSYKTTSSTLTYAVTISKSDLHTTTVKTDGLLFNLSANGKADGTDDENIWHDLSGNLSDTDVVLHNFNFQAKVQDGQEDGTGWLSDSDGSNTRLLVQSGAYVEINSTPLQNDVSDGQGFTFEIDFSTEDVLDANARVASCYSDGKGFWISTEYATLSNNLSPTTVEVTEKKFPAVYDDAGKLVSEAYSQFVRTGPFQVNFSPKERTHVTFVIAKKASGAASTDTTGVTNGNYPMSSMIIYVNGILTNIQDISSSGIKFSNNGSKICLGCDNDHKQTGKCQIYHVRAYGRALSSDEVLNNYISDFTASEQNDLMISNGLVDSQTSSQSGLPSMTLIFKKTSTVDDFANMSKDSKKFCKVVYLDPGNNAKSFTGCAICAWQGTSSLTYAVKNYKIKLYNLATKEETIVQADNSTVTKTILVTNTKQLSKMKYDLGNGITENVFCLKADYMDSSHARNTGTAMFVSDMASDLTPAQQIRPACRTSVYGFPVKLYIQYTDSETYDTTGTGVSYSQPEFFGIYNFNLDKDACDSVGLTTESKMKAALASQQTQLDYMTNYFPRWDCISFEGSANSDSSAGAFVVATDDMTQNASISSDFELRFEDPGDLSNSPSTGEMQILSDSSNKQYVLISGINIDVDGYYVADLENSKLISYNYDPYTDALLIPNGKFTFSKTDGTTILPSSDSGYDGTYEAQYAYKGTGVDSSGNYTDSGKITLTVLTTTDTTGATKRTVTSNENTQLRIDRRFSHLKKLIRWVYEATDQQFKSDFEKHFNMKAVMNYYCTVLTLLLADNLGKNVMWNTWGPKKRTQKAVTSTQVVDGVSKEVTTYHYYDTDKYTSDEIDKYDDYIWYPQFYDMDTELGCDNSGNIRFDVDSEMEKGVFNTSGSILWTKFRRVFATEIKAAYQALRTDSTTNSTLTYSSLSKYYFQNQIKKISESNYNYDMMNKYLNTETKRGYIYMCHGSQYEYLKRWIDQRLYFLDTYFSIGSDSAKSGTVRVEYNDYKTVPVTFNIKTYKPAYVKVKFFNTAEDVSEAESGTVFKKVPRDATVQFQKYVKTATDQEVLIYDAPNIKSFGDVSLYSPKNVLVEEMTHLTDLSVGTTDNPNPNLIQLQLGNNTYLTSLIAESCTAMTTQLDLSKCNNVSYVSTLGSKIPYVQFNQSGCSLSTAHFGASTTLVDIRNCPLLTQLTFESMTQLTTLKIINCPNLLGTAMDANHKGWFYYNVLNGWQPTKTSTEIYLKGFGELEDFQFLDATASICQKLEQLYASQNSSYTLANLQAYIAKQVYLGGQISYRGQNIPNKYSMYGRYFPELTVTYPNVTNVSGMFKNYKNLNSISSKQVATKNEQTGVTTYTTVYYWTDKRLNAGFSTSSYDSSGDRLITAYDQVDQANLANEIKEKIDPFKGSHFTNMDEMFLGDTVLEKILPTTFDEVDVTSASTNQMFYNCQALKYVECPKVTALGNQMFGNCYDTVIYVPKTVDLKQISQYAFSNDANLPGKHQTVLFEHDESAFAPATGDTTTVSGKYKVFEGIRDARFGIKSYGTPAHAMQIQEAYPYYDIIIGTAADGSTTYSVSPVSIPLDIYYFDTSANSADLDSNGKAIPYRLIYDIRKNGSSDNTHNIQITNFNIAYDSVKGRPNAFLNPLHIAELLRNSLGHFDTSYIQNMAIPSMRTETLSSSAVVSQSVYEGSIARIFTDTVTSDFMHQIGQTIITKSLAILSVPGWITRVSSYFCDDTYLQTVIIDKDITKIDNYAFKDSRLSTLQLMTTTLNDGSLTYKLTTIGDEAFKATKLTEIYIPDTVTSIGTSAYENTLNVIKLKYSTAMTYVPISCFAGCDSTTTTCTSISGFSPTNITKIDNYAFDKAYGLKIVQTSDTTGQGLDLPSESEYSSYHCYFANDQTKSSFLNYFTNLEYIGNYAFRGISGIKKIVISTKLQYIGRAAFDPVTSITGDCKTMLVWQFKDGQSFSNLRIEMYAFSGREFCWYCNGHNGFTGVLDKTAFVPQDVYSIGNEAFSCDTYQVAQEKGDLRFMLTDAPESKINQADGKWSAQFVTNHLRTVYDFYAPLIVTSGSGSKSLYFLCRPTDSSGTVSYYAKYARLLTSGTVYAEIAASVKQDSDSVNAYQVTEVIDQAFVGNDASLNTIAFASGSQITSLGSHLFDTNSITQLTVIGTEKYIPTTVTYIGSGTKFINTTWYKSLDKTGLIYLNGILIGFKSSDTDTGSTVTLDSGTTVVYDQAFMNSSSLKQIIFNSGLTKICDQAFQGCTLLESVDFSPCADTLYWIGQQAFLGCSKLTKIVYTKGLTHVGSGVISGTSITNIKFDEGCKLDSTSKPLSPSYDDTTGLNTTITDLSIPVSMGSFFAPTSTVTNVEFMQLSNVDNLIIGNYDEETVDSKYLITDTTSAQYGHYVISLRDFYPEVYAAVDSSGNKIYADDYTDMMDIGTKNVFIKPKAPYYTSELDISKMVSKAIDYYDIFRLIMAYDPANTVVMYMTKQQIAYKNAGFFVKFFGDKRVSAIQKQ